jgi:hypothetical protein
VYQRAFPRTGRYVGPGALDLVEIDAEHDQGRYAETNRWMRHAWERARPAAADAAAARDETNGLA